MCKNHMYASFSPLRYTYFTNASVSLAIASSSLVGITSTLTLESGVEITISCPACWHTILPFVDHFPKNTELYRIMTTKPLDLKKEDEQHDKERN